MDYILWSILIVATVIILAIDSVRKSNKSKSNFERIPKVDLERLVNKLKEVKNK